MIRSSSHTLKFANTGKRAQVFELLGEYRRMLQMVVDHIWREGFELKRWRFDAGAQTKNLSLPSMLPNPFLKEHFAPHTWLSARMMQAVGKQACSMLKAAVRKHAKRLYVLAKLQRQRKFKNARRLQCRIDTARPVKPNASKAKAELDARFLDFEETPDGRFDFFLRIKSIGQKMMLRLPILHTRVSRRWQREAKQKVAIRLEDERLHLIYEKKTSKPRGSEVVGADQGIVTALTLSDGQTTPECTHGHTLSSIQKKLSRCKKGSKGFRRAQAHRENYIGWSLNQLNLSDVKEVRLEKVKNIRRGRRSPRFLSHWTYTLIKEKLERLSETEGFRLKEVPNEFRSQRCSSCGWVRKVNRKGKTFKCSACGFTADADLNAASNLKLDLYEIPFWVRSKGLNRKGFYWRPDGLFTSTGEPIVPQTSKP